MEFVHNLVTDVKFIIIYQEIILKAKIRVVEFYLLTHPPPVLTGPWPKASVFMMKYCGIDIPKNKDRPNM